MVDEAHHAAASSYRYTLPYFNWSIKGPHTVKGPEDQVLNPAVASPKHGVPTAGSSTTFSRHDCLALGSAFDRIVYYQDFLDVIKEQW